MKVTFIIKLFQETVEFFIKGVQCKRIVFMLGTCELRLRVEESGARIDYLKILLVFLAYY